MDVADRHDFLTCLDQYPECNELEVRAHAKRHFLFAVDEVGFSNFGGRDYEVMGRLSESLGALDSEASLWGMVFIDLWHCSNFGGRHWAELVARDPANVRYAIQAAHWVFAVSGADGGRALAAILNRCRCWGIAEQYIPRQQGDGLRRWWETRVLPRREPYPAGG
jgi:hypothetical protein